MITVAAFAAKTHFSQLLDQVEKGEEIVITRHGKPVARLVAPLQTADQDALAERIVARRKAIADRLKSSSQPPITADEIVSWVHEGRR